MADEDHSSHTKSLISELRQLRLENSRLKQEAQTSREAISSSLGWIPGCNHTLNADMIGRYSRQLLVPSFGVQGQQKLLDSSVLVVGAGGLGSSAAIYLAASGVGQLGIVDHDVVALNNLHRQVIHTEAAIGHLKVKSAAAACRAVNSSVDVVEHHALLTPVNSADIISKYDVVVDATDNVPTRYLINDTCVALSKPLVSGAALGMDGQLTVYHYKGSPCYRCLFPVPPPQEACQRCSDSGVLGVVPGIIGSFQALEAIKIASCIGEPLSGRMLLLDAFSARIQIVKLRSRNLDCNVCGEVSRVKLEDIRGFNYESFTGSPLSDESPESLSVIPSSERVSAEDYYQCVHEGKPHLLLDVRERHQYSISALPNSLNIPIAELKHRLQEIKAAAERRAIIVVCRRGNDSQMAVEHLRKNGFLDVADIVGGLESWAEEIDPHFPIY